MGNVQNLSFHTFKMDEQQRSLILLTMRLLQENTRRRFRIFKLLFLALFVQMNSQQDFHFLWDHFNTLYLPRRIWALNRPHYEFDLYVNKEQPDLGYWKSNFRMTSDSFDYICELCLPFLQKQDTRFRETIPLKKRVAVALNWFAHGGNQQSAGAVFGIAKSTSQEIISEFIDGIFAMRNDFIKFPVSLEDSKKVIKTFEGKTLLPNIIGAIDGTLVEIVKPQTSAVDYFSRKQKYMIANQAICDGNLIFLSVDSGFPGSIHDSRMLDHTWIPHAASTGAIFKHPVTTIEGGIKIKPYLLGDPAYPLTSWCMKPYSYHTNEKGERDFNYQLSRARSVIERAFGILKGRWRILNNCIEVSPLRASKIFTVCCILHNILQTRGEDYECIEVDETGDNIPITIIRDVSDENIRSALAEYVQTEMQKENR